MADTLPSACAPPGAAPTCTDHAGGRTVSRTSPLRRAVRRRARDDRGAAAVEFALVSLLLVTLVFGIIEFSLLLRDHVAVTSAVRAGARIASAGAGAGPADCIATTPPVPCTPASAPKLAQDAADAIQRAGSAMPKDAIDELWVYKANTAGYPGTANSMDGATCSSTTQCVKYRWVDATNRFVYVSGGWASTSIAACAGGSTDAVGVYMKATHRFITGMFGVTMNVFDRAVMRFEPLPNDMCQANKPIGGGGHQ